MNSVTTVKLCRLKHLQCILPLVNKKSWTSENWELQNPVAQLYLNLDRAWVRILSFHFYKWNSMRCFELPHNLNSKLVGGILAGGWKAGSPASQSSSSLEDETWTLDNKDEHEGTKFRMLHATNILSILTHIWIASPTQNTGLPRQDWKHCKRNWLFLHARCLAPSNLQKAQIFQPLTPSM